ncbi:MAG: stage II sporulation protein P [Clostridia bacterium]|nr:stage II sporulation protein P [Clostridia bacterium]
MTKLKFAILCSTLGAIVTGVVLCCSGITPVKALSYGVRPQTRSLSVRALTEALPTLPSVPQNTAGATEEPSATVSGGAFFTSAQFEEADYAIHVPAAPAQAEKIVIKQYASSLSVNNSTDLDIDMDQLLEHVPDLDLSGDGPQILIVHTHTSESYNETGQDWYADQDTRTTDNSRNMVRMGEVLSEALTRAGYGVIHCQKRHDEDFNASYANSLKTVEAYLKKYPSIAVVIDLHRDSLIGTGGTKYRPTVTVNGVEMAQVMFLMGVGNEDYPHPHWEENLSLAAWIQREADQTYPGWMRPILVRGLLYNQHLSKGAMLVELGACGNTPAEAETAARCFGEVCAAALDRIREARK